MTDEGLVSFECKVIGYPTPQLCWFKDGKQLQPGDVYELTGSKSLGKTRRRESSSYRMGVIQRRVRL